MVAKAKDRRGEMMRIVAYILMAGISVSHSPFALAAAAQEGASTATNSPLITCSPDTPVVSPGKVVSLNAWAISPTGEPLQAKAMFAWSANAGRITGEGAKAHWQLKDVEPSMYTATVSVRVPETKPVKCALQVVVELANGPGEQIRGAVEDTGRAFLASNQSEASGYGLYSYLLFGSPPSDATRQRYLKAIEAYLTLIWPIASLENWYAPSELNITYLPVDDPPPQDMDKTHLAAWVLAHYNYDHARFLLNRLAGEYREGPYIISVLEPLSAGERVKPYLFQDLSRIPPELAGAWVNEFMNQAAQEHFWQARTLPQLRLKIHGVIAVAAMGLPDVVAALPTWIKVFR
jgi:hypothetical protein